MNDISKSDWKIFREKIGDWQERYMERLMKEYTTYLSSNLPASEKFWGLEKKIKRDKKNPGVLIEMKKSDAMYDLVHLIRYEVITMDDLKDFSAELQEEIKEFMQRA